MFKKILILILVLTATNLKVYAEPADHLVINELKISGEKATDEYVKLYNPTDKEINLVNYKLGRKSLTGTSGNLLTKFPEYKLQPKGYVLIGHNDYIGEKDLAYSSTSYSISDNYAVILFNETGSVLDAVSFGTNKFGEGEPALNPKAGEVLKRKVDGEDSNNNLADFQIITNLPPEEEEPEEGDNDKEEDILAPDISGVIISEIMADPKSPKLDSSDEWIELFNTNGNMVDLSGAIIKDTKGTVREYIIPSGITIDSGRFASFYSSATKISLNNAGDSVELLDASRKIIDKSGDFDKAKTDQSFARFTEGWDWTLEPTPLGENILTILEKEVNQPAAYNLPKKQAKKITTKEVKEVIKKSKEKTPKVQKKNTNEEKNNVKTIASKEKEKKDDKIEAVKGQTEEKQDKFKDVNIGSIVIYLAIFLTINYLIFREKIHEILKQKFGGNN